MYFFGMPYYPFYALRYHPLLHHPTDAEILADEIDHLTPRGHIVGEVERIGLDRQHRAQLEAPQPLLVAPIELLQIGFGDGPLVGSRAAVDPVEQRRDAGAQIDQQ